MSVRPGETLRDQTVSHLRGKETFVICVCLQRISLLLCAEDQQSKNSPQERARGRIQIHRRFTLRSGSIGASSPLPRTTRHSHRLQTETTLRPHLVRPKDTVDPVKQDGVVYRIPYECGKVYIGETGRSMHERIKEHDRDIRLARTQTSAVSEHAHKTGHYPLWNEVKFIDRDPHWYTRRVKEAIHIRLHPDNINRDSGIEIPEAWIPTIKKHNRKTAQQRTTEGTNFSPEQ